MAFFLTLIKSLKKPSNLLLTLMGLLVVAVFVFGARLGLNLLMRMALSFVLALITGGIVVLLNRREKRKQSDAIEVSLVMAAAPSGPDDKTRQKQARDEMAAAISRLKDSRLADGRSGRTALSVLPWYVVLGATGSGKSSTITRSGLPFPSTDDAALSGTAGGNCDWWFSNQAVLLETDGRFASDPSPTADKDWQVFLDLLSKQQRKNTLNGVVLTLGADTLMGSDEATLQQQASLLRKRLDRVTAELDLLVPVYLLLTRCDLINGFGEFFGDLKGKARDQVWGATFSANLMRSPQPGDLFQQEFDLLAQSLERRRLPRLIRTEKARAEQQQAFLFPLEFYGLKGKLQTFVEALFAPSSYGHQPPWRGFYFTAAGGQGGQRAETVLTDVSQVIGLPGFTPATAAPVPVAAGEPYFLSNFFMNVLVTDQQLVRPTARALRREQSWRLALRGLAAAVLPAIVILSFIALFNNLDLLGKGRNLGEEARGLTPAGTQARDLAAALHDLDPLRQQLEQLDGWEGSRPVTRDMGLYHGDDLNRKLRIIYYDRLKTIFLVPSRDRLERALVGEDPRNREEFNRYFNRYQAFRMLLQPEHGQPDLVASQLKDMWLNAPGNTETTARQLQLIEDHVQYAWRHPAPLREVCQDLARAHESLVRRADGYIHEFWKTDLYYENLVAEVNAEGRPFSTQVEPTFSGIFTSGDSVLTVPYAFTHEGWREHMVPRILQSEEKLRQDWLLQEAFRNRTLDIRSELLTKYLGEHHARWVDFLGEVALVPPTGVEQTHTRLRTLAQTTSALFRFLERTRDTMDLDADLDGFEDADRQVVARARDDFSSWHDFFTEKGEGDDAVVPVEKFANLLDELVEYLGSLIQEGDARQNATEATRLVFAENGHGDTALESVARQIPSLVIEGGAASCERALEAYLRRPVMLVWESCLLATERHLNDQWRSTIARDFNEKLNRYPLNPGAGSDIAVHDFSNFFKPQGTLDVFVTEQMGEFLTNEFRPRVVLSRNLRMREEAVTSLQRADYMREVLFPGGVPLPKVVFKLKPQQPTYSRGSGPPVQGTRLRVGDQTLHYDLGARLTEQFTWSGDQFKQDASVALLPADAFREQHRVESSDWALFRLLDMADPVALSDSRYTFTWFVERRGQFRIKVPFELTANSADNPFKRGFFTFACPNQLFE